ncbi:MAG: pyroglutamyl-peptidase I [Pseudomonadota bacterium]
MSSAPSPQHPKVLLTGFDAFGGAALNPSWLAVQPMDGQQLAGHAVVAAQVPTTFAGSVTELKKLIRQHKPALVICVGQAGGRSALSLERVAINVADASIPDNAGEQPVDVAVRHKGPSAYFSTLPIKAMLKSMHAAGIRAEVSQTAGTFVCNQVFYSLMDTLAKQRSHSKVRGGFIHVPYLPEQGTPNMALEEIVRGLRVAVETALVNATDVAHGAGSLS